MTATGLAVWIGAAASLVLVHAQAVNAAPSSCRATDLGTLGGFASRAAAIGADGAIAGSADRASGDTVAVVFRKGRIIPLGTLGGVASAARGIFGQRVVGSSEVAPEVTHAFLWDGQRLRDLGALGEGRDATATAVNRSGEIVGFSQIAQSNASPTHAFVVRHGRKIDLGAPGGGDSIAHDINDWSMKWLAAQGRIGAHTRPARAARRLSERRGAARVDELSHSSIRARTGA